MEQNNELRTVSSRLHQKFLGQIKSLDNVLTKYFALRLAIGVMATAVDDKYTNQIKSCLNTWYRTAKEYNIIVKFFGGYINYDHPDYIQLDGVGEEYQSAFSKQFLGLAWLYQNAPSDFYMIVGTDNYVNILNLLKTLAKYDHKNDLYLGGHGWPSRIKDKVFYYHSGGAGFIISHATLGKIVNNIRNIIAEWPTLCENKACHLPACDIAIAYHLSDLNITPNREPNFYACNYKGKILDGSNMRQCCENVNLNNIITCHYMSTQDMYDYHFYLQNHQHEGLSLSYTVIIKLDSLAGFNNYINSINNLIVVVPTAELILTIGKDRRGDKHLIIYPSANLKVYQELIQINPFKTTHFACIDSIVPADLFTHFYDLIIYSKNGKEYVCGEVKQLLQYLTTQKCEVTPVREQI